jgi:protein SCO1
MLKHVTIRNATLIAAMVVASASGLARAEVPLRADETPKELEGVGIDEKLDQLAPLDLPFKDENGRDVTLRDYLKAGRPVILTPVYYNCPMLCNMTLNGMVDGLNQIELSAGKEFAIVSFSINPIEKPQLAEVKKRAYLSQYKRDTAKDGWFFLTGEQKTIEETCKAIGYGYKPDGKGDFAHTSTILFLTPDGKISRYMNDVVFQPRDLKFALIEASQGAIGSPMDKFLLFMCYHYDPLSNSYAASAKKIMRLGGVMTILAMGTGFCILWWRGSHGGRRNAGATTFENAPEVRR